MLFREEDEDLEVLPFVDRAEAGRVLASKLAAYAGRDDVIVLGLPRGGVPVASTVAGVLHVPFDVFAVSKLGTPWNRELALGAVAEDGVRVLDLSTVRELCVSEEDIQGVASAARKELEYREELYRGGRWQGKPSFSWMMASRQDAAFWLRSQLSVDGGPRELW
ncbi:MAG TPA: hypothetical protein VF311_02250 [Terriglobales bacterium]|jgi:putative phosphoribosyl transferase